MVLRQRAVLAEDKQERHQAILDAAERLLARLPERMASMREVADEAGLAKGTVYLYFPSKEELLLALHERHVDRFFGALGALLATRDPLTIEQLLDLAEAHLVRQPTFLPLATRCFGIMATDVPRETAQAFRERMGARLGAAGAGLERHFAELAPGDGGALLRHSYALILGLWQMSSADADRLPPGVETCALPSARYPEELRNGLRALWQGVLARAAACRAAAVEA